MIIVEEKKKSTAFSDIICGTAFFADNRYCIKIPPVREDATGDLKNAVKLNSGDLTYFEDHDEIKIVDCEIVIH